MILKNPDGTFTVVGRGQRLELGPELGELYPDIGEPPPSRMGALAQNAPQTAPPIGEQVRDWENAPSVGPTGPSSGSGTWGVPSWIMPRAGTPELAPGPAAAVVPPAPAGAPAEDDFAAQMIAARLRRAALPPATSGAGAPVRYKMLPQSIVTQRQAPLPEQEALRLRLAASNYADAVTASGIEQQAANETAATRYEKQAEEARRERRQLELDEEERLALIRPQMDRLEALSEDVQGGRNVWEQGLHSVTAALGVFFGAIGGAITGQPNQALEAMRVKIAQRAQAIEARRSVLQELNSQFLNPAAADAAKRALLSEQAAAEARAMGARLGGADALAKANDLAARLKLDAEEQRAQAARLELGTVTTHEGRVAVGGGGGATPRRDPLDVVVQTGAAYGLDPQQSVATYLSGKLPGAGEFTPKERKELAMSREHFAGRYEAQREMERASTADKELGNAATMLQQIRAYETVQNTAIDAMRTAPLRPLEAWDRTRDALANAGEIRTKFQNEYLRGTDMAAKQAAQMFPSGGLGTTHSAIRAGTNEARKRIVRQLNASRIAAHLPQMTLDQLEEYREPAGYTPAGATEKK